MIIRSGFFLVNVKTSAFNSNVTVGELVSQASSKAFCFSLLSSCSSKGVVSSQLMVAKTVLRFPQTLL